MSEPSLSTTSDTLARLREKATLKGIGFLCLAVFIFSALDAGAKWLGHALPALEIAFARYLFGFIAAAVVFNPWRDRSSWRARRPVMQAVRAIALAGSTACNFVALQHLQLAETVSIGFAAPLLIAALAGPVLGEWIDGKRWMAIGVGFIGVLIIARPDWNAIDPFVLVALAAMGFNTIYSLFTRVLANLESPGSMLLISNGLPVLLFAPALPAIWVTPPDALSWAVVMLLGAFATGGHFFLVRAYGLAPAPIVAPFSYSQILWMGLIGFVLFGDVPSTHTLVGAGIIVASGFYLLWREASQRRGL